MVNKLRSFRKYNWLEGRKSVYLESTTQKIGRTKFFNKIRKKHIYFVSRILYLCAQTEYSGAIVSVAV